MNCKQCHEQLMAYFDHNMDNNQLGSLNSHLESCPGCHKLFSELAGILGSLEATAMFEPEPELEQKVMERIQTMPVLVKQRSDGLAKLFMGSLSLIVVLLLLVATFLFNNISFYDTLIHGRNLIYQFSGVFLSFQIIYHFISGLFSNTIFSVAQQIQIIYGITTFSAVFLAVKTVYDKLTAE